MDDPEDTRFTLSFDLLFHGLEITTGGQRIHDYNALLKKIEDRGMETEGMEQYLDTFKYGMPPHGGLGIGLELSLIHICLPVSYNSAILPSWQLHIPHRTFYQVHSGSRCYSRNV